MVAALMATINDLMNIPPDFFHECDAWACTHTRERAHVIVTKMDSVSWGALHPMILF